MSWHNLIPNKTGFFWFYGKLNPFFNVVLTLVEASVSGLDNKVKYWNRGFIVEPDKDPDGLWMEIKTPEIPNDCK